MRASTLSMKLRAELRVPPHHAPPPPVPASVTSALGTLHYATDGRVSWVDAPPDHGGAHTITLTGTVDGGSTNTQLTHAPHRIITRAGGEQRIEFVQDLLCWQQRGHRLTSTLRRERVILSPGRPGTSVSDDYARSLHQVSQIHRELPDTLDLGLRGGKHVLPTLGAWYPALLTPLLEAGAALPGGHPLSGARLLLAYTPMLPVGTSLDTLIRVLNRTSWQEERVVPDTHRTALLDALRRATWAPARRAAASPWRAGLRAVPRWRHFDADVPHQQLTRLDREVPPTDPRWTTGLDDAITPLVNHVLAWGQRLTLLRGYRVGRAVYADAADAAYHHDKLQQLRGGGWLID